MTNCGASSESCCASLEVTGGTYYRSYANSGTGPTGEAAPAAVTGFRLDKYLATVGRFRQFVNAWNGGYTPPAGSGKHTHLNAGLGLANGDGPGTYESGWVTTDDSNIAPTSASLTSCSPDSTWTASVGSQENLPIDCVNWYEAYAFCIWDGGFLPSEAEWEYAAAGGNEQREYPWGATPPAMGNQYAIYGWYYMVGSGSALGEANVAPVGTATMGGGLWGQFDLAGNVEEWNLDGYDDYVDPCSECANLTSVSSRVIRGGYFGGGVSALLPQVRYYFVPSNRDYALGFRCARAP
jgi:formylglycine-generating enzyme